MRYPEDGTMFPQALSPILFQYAPGMGNDTVRLAFDSDVLHLVVLSGGDRWQPDAAIWNLLAESNVGGQAALSIDAAASASPGTVYAGAALTLDFAAAAIAPALAYQRAPATPCCARRSTRRSPVGCTRAPAT